MKAQLTLICKNKNIICRTQMGKKNRCNRIILNKGILGVQMIQTPRPKLGSNNKQTQRKRISFSKNLRARKTHDWPRSPTLRTHRYHAKSEKPTTQETQNTTHPNYKRPRCTIISLGYIKLQHHITL